jgi:hypothetical protein
MNRHAAALVLLASMILIVVGHLDWHPSPDSAQLEA